MGRSALAPIAQAPLYTAHIARVFENTDGAHGGSEPATLHEQRVPEPLPTKEENGEHGPMLVNNLNARLIDERPPPLSIRYGESRDHSGLSYDTVLEQYIMRELLLQTS